MKIVEYVRLEMYNGIEVSFKNVLLDQFKSIVWFLNMALWIKDSKQVIVLRNS